MTAEGRPDTPARQSQTAATKNQKIMQVKFFQIPSGGGGDERVSTIAAEKKGAWPSRPCEDRPT